MFQLKYNWESINNVTYKNLHQFFNDKIFSADSLLLLMNSKDGVCLNSALWMNSNTCIPLCRAFQCHPFIGLIWLKYWWKNCNMWSHLHLYQRYPVWRERHKTFPMMHSIHQSQWSTLNWAWCALPLCLKLIVYVVCVWHFRNRQKNSQIRIYINFHKY